MIGSDNDDFVLSTSMMPGSSSIQATASQSIPISNTKSTTLESDSSSSSSSSDSSSSDYEMENVSVPTATNGKQKIYFTILYYFFTCKFIENISNSILYI